MNACVIFNPSARGDKASRLRKFFASLSDQCALKPTFAAGTARELGAEAVREGFETIIAGGGDGTVNEVVNGIASVPGGLVRARLAVLPLGTVNVFAKELRMPGNLHSAWGVIQTGRERSIDVAQADFYGSAGSCRRYFVQMAGAGWDARAVELVNWELKKRIGALAYVAAGLQALRQPLPSLVAECDGAKSAGELVLIGNGSFYGGRWRVFPKADLCDGLLEVSVFPRLNWLGLARGVGGLLGGQLYGLGGVRHLRGRSVRLTSSACVPFEVEGENAGDLPVTFSIEQQKLRVVVPGP